MIYEKYNIYLFFKPLDIIIYLFTFLFTVILLRFLTVNNTCKYLLK